MTKAKLFMALAMSALIAQPAMAQTKLGDKDRARVQRAAPGERQEVRACLVERKKGGKKGAIIGAAGGAGVGVIAGGNVGETLLGAGAGALAGHLIGKGSGRHCGEVLRRNP